MGFGSALGGFFKEHGLDVLGMAANFIPGGGIIKDVAASIAGVGSDASEEEVVAALQARPELIVELKKYEMEHAAELRKIALAGQTNELAAEAGRLRDVQDARKRDVELRKAGDKNWRANIMVAMAFVAILVITITLGLGAIDPASAVAGFMFSIGGMFARNIGTAFDYEFGSSRGSAEKSKTLGETQQAAE